jgi:hypothetical protein
MVTAKYEATFENGLVKTHKTEKPSEALAIASLPLDIIRAVFQTTAELIQLKIDTSGKETALANAKVAEIDAKKALETKLADKLGTAESAVAVVGAKRRGVLMEVSTGQGSRSPADEVRTPGSTFKPPSLVSPGSKGNVDKP